VIAVTPTGNTFAPVNTLRVTFDEPIDPTTATPDQFAIQDPFGNPVNVNAVTPVDGSNGQQFDVAIDQQTVAGTYQVSIGPFVADTAGHYMDQDGDGGMVGDVDDGFSGSFAIQGPSVVSTTLTGSFDEVDHGQVVFNTAIDPNSFTPDQFVLLDPGGNPVNVTSITAADGTNTRFDVTFDPQTALGTYSLTIGPNITDAFGNPMPAPYTGTFRIISELVVNGGFETGDFTGWTVTGAGPNLVTTGASHSGTYAAWLGAVGSDGFVSQVVPTTAGRTYHLQYWLDHTGGGTPNDFSVQLNGVTLAGSTFTNDTTNFAYRAFDFDFTATGATTLRFSAREDPAYWHLDDVSVMPGTGPAPSGGGAGHAAFVSATLAAGHALVGGGGLGLPAGASGGGGRLLPAEGDTSAALSRPAPGGSLAGDGAAAQALSGGELAAPLAGANAFKHPSAAQRPALRGTEALDGFFTRLGEEAAPL
jgi:hypothetical protein